jgi:hypothetical protein
VIKVEYIGERRRYVSQRREDVDPAMDPLVKRERTTTEMRGLAMNGMDRNKE